MLGLESLLDRKPKALSGGQRQRVAVGRAIVRKPKVFLFDEPLSNLDAKMRVSMRTEIARLHAHIGATMIYVTHDQVEAMTMGDRICIMKDGEIQQVAEPLSLYNQPANLYAAGFIGSPPMNFFRGTLRKEGAGVRFVEANAKGAPVTINLPPRLAAAGRNHVDKAVVLGIRPEDLHEESTPREGATATVKVDVSEPMGAETYLYLNSGATSFIARVKPTEVHAPGSSVHLAFTPETLHLFDASSEAILTPPTSSPRTPS
jgi:multiple sugar transport system ATP-binding protein